MKTLEIENIELAKAIVEVKNMDYSQQKVLAGTTKDEALLEALAEIAEKEITKAILKNPSTSSRVLKKFVSLHSKLFPTNARMRCKN